MDQLIMAAAGALAAGDVFGVLRGVGLRGDAPALALRGLAMVQLVRKGPPAKRGTAAQFYRLHHALWLDTFRSSSTDKM